MEDFDVRLGWVPLVRALEEFVTPVAGDRAWEQIKTAIRHEKLPARCLADGVTTDFKPHWLDFVIKFEDGWASGEAVAPHELSGRRDLLSFDRRKALEAGIAIAALPPIFAENIFVSWEHCRKLWPSGTGSASNTDAVVAEQVPTSPLVKAPSIPSSAIRFVNPVWDLRDVIGWVLDRDPAKFGRLMNEIDVQSAVRRTKLYTRWPRPEYDANAQTTLLHALQRGNLAAHHGETTLAREYWGSRTEQDFPRTLRLGVWFWRYDVLRLWPEAEEPIIAETAPRKRQRPSDEDLDRWMNENVRPGAKRDPTIADCCKANGARVRDAKRAWGRLPSEKRLKRGQKPSRPDQIEH